MRPKQILAIVVLLFIAFLIVYPSLASSSVAVALSPSSSLTVEHVFVTIAEISAHRADTREPSGWSSVSNKTIQVDLAAVNLTQSVALGSLPLGQYDTIRIRISNATVVVNGTSKKAQLSSSVFTASVSFMVQLGAQANVLLKVTSGVNESTGTTTLNLSFTAIPTKSS